MKKTVAELFSSSMNLPRKVPEVFMPRKVPEARLLRMLEYP